MRVVVSLLFLRPGRVSGSETYVRKLLKHLSRRSGLQLILVGEKATLTILGELDRCSLVPITMGRYKAWTRLFHENLTLARIGRRFQADLYFFPANFCAPLLPSGAPQVATIHDLQHLELPGNFSVVTRTARQVLFRGTCSRAAHLIAISRHTRTGVIERFGVSPERISTVHHGVEPETASPERDEPSWGNYFLYPAKSLPHKNHLTAIRALADLRKRTGIDCHLVFTGTHTPYYADVELEIDRLDLTGCVHHCGFLSRARLLGLMSDAQALLFPSAFEGFGLPILEAMLRGVPVLAASNSSIPEVVGNGGWLLPTHDVAAWSSAMERILVDGEARARLAAAGREQAATFSWSRCAAATAEVFSRVVEDVPEHEEKAADPNESIPSARG